VETRWHSLLRLAYLLTGDRGRAEDLVQSALVRVHRHWRRVERADGHDAYARRTMINLNISWWRRRRVEEHLVDQLPEPPAARGHADAHADRDQLVRGLATLPPRCAPSSSCATTRSSPKAECAAALGCSLRHRQEPDLPRVGAAARRPGRRIRDRRIRRSAAEGQPAMSTDFESTLRTALRERADDVAPTPDPWSRTERAVRRSRSLRRTGCGSRRGTRRARGRAGGCGCGRSRPGASPQPAEEAEEVVGPRADGDVTTWPARGPARERRGLPRRDDVGDHRCARARPGSLGR
jgi:hypothetical protein